MLKIDNYDKIIPTIKGNDFIAASSGSNTYEYLEPTEYSGSHGDLYKALSSKDKRDVGAINALYFFLFQSERHYKNTLLHLEHNVNHQEELLMSAVYNYGKALFAVYKKSTKKCANTLYRYKEGTLPYVTLCVCDFTDGL